MSAPVVTDHFVPHVSTIPANKGDAVKLFVRERNGTAAGGTRRPVLMLHGRSVPALAGFDLAYKKYSWAAELAKKGFDVFVMELQGSGLSTRPGVMDDPRNVSPSQQGLLVPNPNTAQYTGLPAYGSQLNNSQSDWDEVDRVVDHVLGLTGASKVDLIGWSAAAQQFGPYAIQHPGKVRSLFLLAPIFPPKGRASASGTAFGAPVATPVSTPPAAFGFPMSVGTKSGFQTGWDRDVHCPDQREADMVDVVWQAIMDSDLVGSKWGGTVTGAPEGLNRIRNSYWWGWNAATVPLDGTLGGAVPVCIVYGEYDTTVNTSPDLGLLYFSVPELYRLIPGAKKLMFRIACASHQVPWERPASLVHTMSEQWLKHGKVEGAASGAYDRDDDGVLTPMV